MIRSRSVGAVPRDGMLDALKRLGDAVYHWGKDRIVFSREADH